MRHDDTRAAGSIAMPQYEAEDDMLILLDPARRSDRTFGPTLRPRLTTCKLNSQSQPRFDFSWHCSFAKFLSANSVLPGVWPLCAIRDGRNAAQSLSQSLFGVRRNSHENTVPGSTTRPSMRSPFSETMNVISSSGACWLS